MQGWCIHDKIRSMKLLALSLLPCQGEMFDGNPKIINLDLIGALRIRSWKTSLMNFQWKTRTNVIGVITKTGSIRRDCSMLKQMYEVFYSALGLMLMFWWNTFSGSYLSFNCFSLSCTLSASGPCGKIPYLESFWSMESAQVFITSYKFVSCVAPTQPTQYLLRKQKHALNEKRNQNRLQAVSFFTQFLQ